MKFVMLDLETTGNRINPVIVQISAVEFDLLTGECGKEFNILVARETCKEVGLSENASTIEWWSNQSEEARAIVFSEENRYAIEDALTKFSEWLESLRTEDDRTVYLWGNGVRADNVWLLSAYKACNMDDPIEYNEDLDFRTLHLISKMKTGKDLKKEIPFEGTPHNAIDDCKWQIKVASAMFNTL